jgi:hypothetical protein
MNVKPKNYDWPEFYDHVIDVSRHSFSWRAIARRHRAVSEPIPRWMNVVRATSSEGFGRIRYYSTVRRLLDTDRGFRRYFEGETNVLPPFFVNRARRDLGAFWPYLPEGGLYHNPHEYLETQAVETHAAEILTLASISPSGAREAERGSRVQAAV